MEEMCISDAKFAMCTLKAPNINIIVESKPTKKVIECEEEIARAEGLINCVMAWNARIAFFEFEKQERPSPSRDKT